MENIVFGIDLGTTYSCIAYIDENGKPVVIPDSSTHAPVVPSVVYFPDDGETVIVGDEAKRMMEVEKDTTVAFAKRSIGIKGKKFNIHGKDMLPQSISAQVLKRLAKSAKDKLNVEVKDVVITCPAYFGIEERAATKNAGELAGLNVMAILDEPSAAAFAYGLETADSTEERIILVYDLGGGTFDVTVMRQQGHKFIGICTGGDHHLGGKDWDDKLFNYLVNVFCEEKGRDKADFLADHESVTELRLDAERIKRRLTEQNEVRYNVQFDGEKCRGTITRADFDAITRPLVEDTISKTIETIEKAQIKCEKEGIPFSGKFDELILVGGSSKMPMIMESIQSELAGYIGKEPIIFDPDESIAKGAAIYARQLAQTANGNNGDATPNVSLGGDFQAISVSSRTFGVVATVKEVDKVVNLIYINQNLPITITKDIFSVRYDGQRTIKAQLFESIEEDEFIDLDQGIKIGEADITGIPGELKAGERIEITFSLDDQGILSGSAIERQFNTSVNFEFKTERVELITPEQDAGHKMAVVN